MKRTIKRNSQKVKRSRRRGISRRQRGGGDKIHACKIPVAFGEPPAIKNNVVAEVNTDNRIKDAILAIPSDVDFVVIKIGSNDNEDVQKGKFKNGEYGYSNGTKGKEGVHYIEYPLTGQEGSTTTAIDINKALQKQISILIKTIGSLGENGYLMAVSPIPSYTQFEYPFFDKTETNKIEKILFHTIAQKIQTSVYIQSFFPLNVYGKNKDLLDLIVKIDKPVILFNAMASTCYTSMKYIIDMRFRKNYKTYYMGLADVQNQEATIECDVFNPIYPDRKESCKDELKDPSKKNA
jgi:hypothetical protein